MPEVITRVTHNNDSNRFIVVVGNDFVCTVYDKDKMEEVCICDYEADADFICDCLNVVEYQRDNTL